MTTIPQQQLYNRWDILPDVLKEAIASETNSDVVWKTAEDEHLSEDKIRRVSKLTGYTLMGFLHPEDFADEVKKELDLNPNIANSIASAINAKVFSPLRADLDKVYAPASEEKPGGPRLVEEIKKPESIPVAPKPAASTLPVQPPSPLKGAAPKIITTETPTPAPAPAPAPAPKPAAPIAPASPIKPVLPAAVSPSPKIEGPVIIHQESSFQPIRQASGFKLDIPVPEPRGGKPAWVAPPKPAQIEMPISPAASRPETPKPTERIVHYNELKTPLPPKPAAPPPAQKPSAPSPTAPQYPKIVPEKELPDPLKGPELPKPQEKPN